MMENVGLIFASSGTTGQPKGVQLTQTNLWFSLAFENMKLLENGCFLNITPWTHMYGCFSLCRTAIHGMSMVSLTKFEEKLYFECIEKYKVTTLIVVPPLMVHFAKSSHISKHDMSSLQYAYSSAAPLSKELIESVQKLVPQLKVRQIYGMSEIGTILLQTDIHCKPGSVGALRPGAYVKVVNPETGETLGPNLPGELLFKSPGIMKGYVGYYDDDQEWFIVDRLKELIKYKGFQVPPAELEALLLTHPDVKDAGVIGLPDELAGELPMAFVVKEGNCSEKDIIDFVALRTSPAKRLHGGVKFIAEIPKNPTAKILRRVLRDLIKQNKSKL